jgi:hypothetical protein
VRGFGRFTRFIKEKVLGITGDTALGHVLLKIEQAIARLRNNTTSELGHDPSITVPLKALVPVTLSAALYCIARAYILIEDLANLRSLPQSAYETVNWTKILPHF